MLVKFLADSFRQQGSVSERLTIGIRQIEKVLYPFTEGCDFCTDDMNVQVYKNIGHNREEARAIRCLYFYYSQLLHFVDAGSNIGFKSERFE